jgi:hypothetical protein
MPREAEPAEVLALGLRAGNSTRSSHRDFHIICFALHQTQYLNSKLSSKLRLISIGRCTMSAPEVLRQTTRRWVMTGAVAAVAITGSIYGAGLKSRQELKQVRAGPSLFLVAHLHIWRCKGIV